MQKTYLVEVSVAFMMTISGESEVTAAHYYISTMEDNLNIPFINSNPKITEILKGEGE